MHSYSHLLSGAARGLECASCLHVDDIGESISVDKFFAHAFAFFDEIHETPRVVSYQVTKETKHRRSSIRTFRNNIVGSNHAVGTTLRSVSITGEGFEDGDISDTWTPRSVVSIAVNGNTLDGFWQSPKNFEKEHRSLVEIPFCTFGGKFSSAYVFPYPFVFSPIAYANGLSYSPNIRKFGCLAERDSDRVANWANHCYRGYRASDGYLRDLYTINLISQEHIATSVHGLLLIDWIKQDASRGAISEFCGKWLWILDDRYINAVQKDLDSAKFLLSGFAP